jgi:thioredoxin 1
LGGSLHLDAGEGATYVRDTNHGSVTGKYAAGLYNQNSGDDIMATNVSDQSFDEEVLKSSEHVLVDFHAEWCGPCKAMAPALEEVSTEMAGKVKVVKVDVDANPEITTKYQIQAMPTLIILKDGEVVGRHTGALVQKSKLEAWINSTVEA